MESETTSIAEAVCGHCKSRFSGSPFGVASMFNRHECTPHPMTVTMEKPKIQLPGRTVMEPPQKKLVGRIPHRSGEAEALAKMMNEKRAAFKDPWNCEMCRNAGDLCTMHEQMTNEGMKPPVYHHE